MYNEDDDRMSRYGSMCLLVDACFVSASPSATLSLSGGDSFALVPMAALKVAHTFCIALCCKQLAGYGVHRCQTDIEIERGNDIDDLDRCLD